MKHEFPEYMARQRQEREEEEFAAGLMPVAIMNEIHDDGGLPTPISGDATLIRNAANPTFGRRP